MNIISHTKSIAAESDVKHQKASACQRLIPDLFCHILSFLEPEQVLVSEKICRVWKEWNIQSEQQIWDTQIPNCNFVYEEIKGALEPYSSKEVTERGYFKRGGNVFFSEFESYFGLGLIGLITDYHAGDCIYSRKKLSLQMHLAVTQSNSTFGKKKWEEYIGDVGEVPPLPRKVYSLMQTQCPFMPQGYTIRDTHLLVFLPKAINKEQVTLASIEKWTKAPKKGNSAKYEEFPGSFHTLIDMHGSTLKVWDSQWFLMFKGDYGRGSSLQEIMNTAKIAVPHHSPKIMNLTKLAVPYHSPRLIQAVTAIFMEYVVNGNRLFGDSPMSLTGCLESFFQSNLEGRQYYAVGNFSSKGLRFTYFPAHKGNPVTGIGFVLELT